MEVLEVETSNTLCALEASNNLSLELEDDWRTILINKILRISDLPINGLVKNLKRNLQALYQLITVIRELNGQDFEISLEMIIF